VDKWGKVGAFFSLKPNELVYNLMDLAFSEQGGTLGFDFILSSLFSTEATLKFLKQREPCNAER
jgi:hypothetical protein